MHSFIAMLLYKYRIPLKQVTTDYICHIVTAVHVTIRGAITPQLCSVTVFRLSRRTTCYLIFFLFCDTKLFPAYNDHRGEKVSDPRGGADTKTKPKYRGEFQ